MKEGIVMSNHIEAKIGEVADVEARMKVAHVFVTALDQIIGGVESALDVVNQNAVVIQFVVIAVHHNDWDRKIAELAEIGRSHFGCKKKNALTVHSAECIELAVNIHGLIKIGDMKRTALAGAFGGDSFGKLGEKRRVGSDLSVLFIIDQLNNAGGSAGGFIFFSAHSHTRLRFLKPALLWHR